MATVCPPIVYEILVYRHDSLWHEETILPGQCWDLLNEGTDARYCVLNSIEKRMVYTVLFTCVIEFSCWKTLLLCFYIRKRFCFIHGVDYKILPTKSKRCTHLIKIIIRTITLINFNFCPTYSVRSFSLI